MQIITLIYSIILLFFYHPLYQNYTSLMNTSFSFFYYIWCVLLTLSLCLTFFKVTSLKKFIIFLSLCGDRFPLRYEHFPINVKKRPHAHCLTHIVLFFQKIADYLSRHVIRPFVRSYGDISIVTLSPGKMRMKFLRSLPLICANT